MNHKNMDLIMNEPIHDPICPVDYFPDSKVANLGDDSPGLWERRQPFDGSNKLLGHEERVVRRVLRNELANRPEVFNGPPGPDQWHHLSS